jgi:hypothetical protein
LTKNCRCPKNRRQILTLPPTVVNPHNISLQITTGVMAKFWQAGTCEVANFVVGCGKIAIARNFHATIKTAGEMKWIVIRELGI